MRSRSRPGEAAVDQRHAPNHMSGSINLKGACLAKLFAVLATLLTLLIAARFFLAAVGAFDTGGQDEAFQPHRSLEEG